MKIRVVGFSVLGAGALVAAGLALFAFDFPRLSTNEMAPTLRARDLLLACRACGRPERGDVVFFEPPDTPGPLIPRRVVAGPGDKVEIKKGRILVNDRPLFAEKGELMQIDGIDAVDSAPRAFQTSVETLGKHRYQVLVDARAELSGTLPAETLKDEYFVVADRRTFVRDSRDFGPIPRAHIRSIVLRVISAGDDNAARQTRLP
jgi:signal peptidase I